MNNDEYRLRQERRWQARRLADELAARAAHDRTVSEAVREVRPRTDRKSKRLAREQECSLLPGPPSRIVSRAGRG